MSVTIELVSIESNKNAINDEEISTTTIAASEEIATISQVDEELKEPHDGGYGWLIVLAGFLFQSSCIGLEFGCNNNPEIGIMQDYYNHNVFNKTQSQLVQLSFVGTMLVGTISLSSPFTQMAVSRFGLRTVMLIGAIFIALALEIAAQSTEIWHLYLTQGLLFGMGTSCIYINIMAIAPQRFTKNRGIALGIMGGGTAAGGLIVPNIMTAVNQKLGPSWTYRILGCFCFVFALFACAVVKERVPSKPGKKKFNQIIQLNVLKNKNYLLFLIAANVGLFGSFIPFFYLPSFATHCGLSESQGSALIAVTSASDFIGRIIAGMQADRIGYFNSYIIFNVIASLSSFFVWIFAKNYGPLLVYAVLFGFGSGSYYVLMPPIFTTILPADQFHSGLSLAFMTNCIPIFGVNISSVIQEKVDASPFFTHIMFTGVSYLLGAILLFGLKLRFNKHILSKI